MTDRTPVVTLREGGTPLIPAPAVAERIGRGVKVFLKYDGLNPTGSFKDRGMTMAVSKAREAGAEAVICALTVPDAAGAYFVSDGEPVALRVFLARRIAAAGLRVPRVSIPSGAAWALAGVVDALWRVLHLRAEPPLTREVVRLMGFPFTLDITRARQALGYRPVVSIEDGMRRLERGGATGTGHGSLAGAPPARPPHRDLA